MTLIDATTTPRRSYAKSVAIRQRILDACITAFGQSGFYGATMKDIAGRAGISHTGLLHHFPNKESLLVAVLDYRDKRSQTVWQAALEQLGETPENTVRSMLAAVVANELEPGLAALHASLSAEATSPEHPAHEYFKNRYRASRDYYQHRFEEIAERGHLDARMSPQALSFAFIAILDGLQIQWLYEKDNFRMEEVFEQFLDSISRP